MAKRTVTVAVSFAIDDKSGEIEASTEPHDVATEYYGLLAEFALHKFAQRSKLGYERSCEIVQQGATQWGRHHG